MYRLLTLLFTIISISSFAQQKWDLQGCVNYALTNNVSVKQADVQARLSRLTAKQAKGALLPTLNGGMNGSYQHGLNENPTTGTLESADFLSGSIGLQSGYTIFNWGVRKNNIAANELYAQADAVGVDRAKNDVALTVANAFLQVMLRKEQVRISEVQLNQSKEQLRTTRKLVDAGAQPELNAIQIEAQLARDTSALLQAQSLVEQSLINLKAYMNLDFATPFDIVAPTVENIPIGNITDLQAETVFTEALGNQPLQKMIALRTEGAKYQAKASRGAMYPTLSAFGGLDTRFVNAKVPTGTYSIGPTSAYVTVNGVKEPVYTQQFVPTGTAGIPLFRQIRNNFGQSVGLSINFSILNGWNARTQWERSKVNITQVQLQDEQERLTLRTNVYNAYQDAFSSLQKYNASVRSVEASQKAFDFSQKRYNIGLMSTLDFITTQNNLFRARIEAISNQYDYVFKMKVLEFYRGNGIKL